MGCNSAALPFEDGFASIINFIFNLSALIPVFRASRAVLRQARQAPAGRLS